jgi:hypothetical protein
MRCAAIVLLCGWLTGCGYIGDPQPPALNIPLPIQDLQAAQVGGKIRLRFTIPDLTTEQLPVTDVTVDLRGGDVPIPVAARAPGVVEAEAPVTASWVGQEIAFQVRLQNAKGRYSAPSNQVVRRVVAPVATPAGFTAKPVPNGMALQWTGAGQTWLVFRDGAQVASVTKAEYLDAAVEAGKSYRYQVQASMAAGTDVAVSEKTGETTVAYTDTFAPAQPAGLNVIASTNANELSWERSTEADLKHYRVWRDGVLLADAVDVPAYTDRTVESGKKYRYAVSAVDAYGNESSQSQPVEITTP